MSEEVEPTRYVNGTPDNLPAAAWDALEWLVRIPKPSEPVNRERLEKCIECLQKHLGPHLVLDPVYLMTLPAEKGGEG